MRNQLDRFFISVAEFFELGGNIFTSILRKPFYAEDTLYQMYSIGIQSLPIVTLTNLFTGMIYALQTGHELAIFGAKMYVGSLLSISFIRELGPVLTALVIAGRVGAGIAAELGSMKVTEQIDAMRAMGTDPIKKLAVTRVLAGLTMVPALTILANGVGLFGGLFVATTVLGISAQFYWKTVFDILIIDDVIMSILKSVVFGLIIVWVACYVGFSTTGGTEGVGRSTTKSVVISSVAILVGDYFITQILLWVLRI